MPSRPATRSTRRRARPGRRSRARWTRPVPRLKPSARGCWTRRMPRRKARLPKRLPNPRPTPPRLASASTASPRISRTSSPIACSAGRLLSTSEGRVLTTSTFSTDCESRRKRGLALAIALATLFALTVRPARAQEPAHEQPAAAAQGTEAPHGAVAHETAEGEAHEERIWPFIGKIFNFAVLAGPIVYFARTPLSNYLPRRRSEVRADLETAQTMKTEAAARIAEIEARMKALPAEIDALRARG